MNRTLIATRMQFVNRWSFAWIPLIVLFAVFAFTLIIFALIPLSDAKYGGGAQAPAWVMLSAGIMAMSSGFPFSQAMSITRKEFYLGTLIAASITSAGLGVVFALGGMLEDLTNGWGINGHFFRLDWLWQAGPVIAGLFFFTLSMLLFTLGFFFATVFRRWGAPALTVGLVGLGLVFVGIAALITLFDAWVAVAAFAVNAGVTGLTLLMLVLTIVFAATAYLPLRRSTP